MALTRHLTEHHLKAELEDLGDRFPRLAKDGLFVAWFLRAFVTDSEDEAVEALTGVTKDKGIDAILIDDPAKMVFIVQGKYRRELGKTLEARADVVSFANLASDLASDNGSFQSLIQDIDQLVRQRLQDARERIHRRKYRLHLYYLTAGKCSTSLVDEARHIVQRVDHPSSLDIFDSRRVLLLLSDYLDGVAPPVPSLDLEMESGQGVQAKGILQRLDKRTDIESWVFSMPGGAVGDIYRKAGSRLFARNVRGFLGSTEINRGMESTIENEPEYFWYYNNGITIICDHAEQVSGGGRDILRVTNPQIINGQQTTRTLHRLGSKAAKCSVLVRVIRVSRDLNDDSGYFESLVSRIVASTNWQNAITPSDLMSNDRRQIEIERQLRKLNYWYIRKRQTKSEARGQSGVRHYILIKKEELAQAVAACDLDPVVVREGKEGLFEERLYPHVFPNGDPYYYLSRYWLMREVSYAASGYPERAYAKWIVLNFVWSHLAPLVRARAGADCFRLEIERTGLSEPFLNKAINIVFAAAISFYRKKRGKGATAADVSTFFKRKALHKEFQKFWNGSGNKRKGAFRKAWLSYEAAFRQEMEQ
jgi:hypothetical protein